MRALVEFGELHPLEQVVYLESFNWLWETACHEVEEQEWEREHDGLLT